jgi:hypothetical protein
LDNLKNALSDDNFQDGAFGTYGARHIKELAFGMIDGLEGWDTHGDALDTDVGTLQELGKSIYLSQIAHASPVSDVVSDPGKWARYTDLLIVWNQYQRIYGPNAPLTRCQTGAYKQWDVNFEGVAHYGLIPDFIQDLSNVGLQAPDMSVLFHSAEAFAQMWVKCLQGSYAFVPHFVGQVMLPSAGALTITFTTGDQPYVLQETGTLEDPGSWQAATILSSATNGVVHSVLIPATNEVRFYRLRHT